MPPLLVEQQPAGLSTAESESSSSRSMESQSLTMRVSPGTSDRSVSPSVSDVKSAIDSVVEAKPQNHTAATTPESRRSPPTSLKKIVSIPKLIKPPKPQQVDEASRRHNIDPSLLSLSASIGGSAPTILIRALSVDAIESKSIRSIMTSRTLHESLHQGRAQRPTPNRSASVNFGTVNIREYERVLGDNPSVTSGPPLSIGWRYAPTPIQVDVDTFESGKGSPRSSSEYLVPKAVREKILREHADVSRRDVAIAVRNINRQKQQRRKTVVNLPLAKTEEKIEKLKRGVQKVIMSRSSYNKEEARLWDEAHAVAMEKARRLEESIRNGEKLSMKKVYEVGTPWNNVVPSVRNLMEGNREGALVEDARTESCPSLNEGVKSAVDAADIPPRPKSADTPETLVSAFNLKPSQSRSERRVSIDSHFLDKSEQPHAQTRTRAQRLENFRHSDSDIGRVVLKTRSEIVASENENDVDEIFAKLLLDDM